MLGYGLKRNSRDGINTDLNEKHFTGETTVPSSLTKVVNTFIRCRISRESVAIKQTKSLGETLLTRH